jgi:putative ABC transport system permease protein
MLCARLSKTVLVPAFISFTLPTFGIVLFLNYFVIGLSNIFSASYLVILSGMLLGNSLRGNIVGISHFYESLRKNEREYLFRLGLGISKKQALLPFLTQSVELALKPSFAAMATMGIVALPGMMTGVILGGASPEKAIKYQIMIMIAIVVSTISSVIMTLLLTGRTCFDEYGILKKEIFIDDKSL